MEGDGEVTREKTRIYVGGLGGSVTEDDLRKTFSALGEVVSVDVVRTKGRSFAYLDFLPSSDKSLPKLFSTYNGCMWKGGKLRLEKAKEHYLVRLRREWEDEAQPASKESDPDESKTLEKPKKPSSEINTQLRLFFPKLGKVKSLGQVGIGKHKYSFQRIQVPPIPTHFCDCEEHAIAFIPTNKKQISESENKNDGINEQELDIMNSVMNKIFERANPSKQVIHKSNLVNKGFSNSMDATENIEEDHMTDEDNLIINVATGSEMDLLGEVRTMMANQNGQKKKTVQPVKKRKSRDEANNPVIPESSKKSRKESKIEVESILKNSGTNSLRSLKLTWKDLIGRTGRIPFTIPNTIPTVHQEKEEESNGHDHIQNEEEPGTHLEMKTVNEDDTKRSPEKHAGDTIRGGSRRQKSSWTKLVSTASHSSFSISQIVPDLSFENHEPQGDEPSPDPVVTELTGDE